MSKYALILLGLLFITGCVEVGGSSSDVCTGTECGDGHNDNSDSSTTDVTSD
mgnify:CR=1 FL=1